jgi:3-deoxy-D-manno-octulosonic-acid transferase
MWRRSLWSGEPLAGGVFLVDSIGELAALYSLATVAFVGGSLVPRGGHNILEPALYGVPIVTGNHYENFRDVVNFFASRNAVRIVGLAELPLVFMELIENGDERDYPRPERAGSARIAARRHGQDGLSAAPADG